MDWFHHKKDASADPVIHAAEDRFKHQGYNAYFKICELLAANFDPHYPGKVKIKLKHLANVLRMKSKTVHKILEYYQSERKITYEIKDGMVHLYMPKFVELADNYTKRILKEMCAHPEAPSTHSVRTFDGIEEKRREEKERGSSYTSSEQVKGRPLWGTVKNVLQTITKRKKK